MSAPPFHYRRGLPPTPSYPPPPPLLITPDYFPEFVIPSIPRSPSLLSEASDYELHWAPNAPARLQLPLPPSALRSRSHSNPPSPLMQQRSPRHWTPGPRKNSLDYLHEQPPDLWAARREDRRPSTIASNLPATERRRLPRTPSADPALTRPGSSPDHRPLAQMRSSSGRRLPEPPTCSPRTTPNISPAPSPLPLTPENIPPPLLPPQPCEEAEDLSPQAPVTIGFQDSTPPASSQPAAAFHYSEPVRDDSRPMESPKPHLIDTSSSSDAEDEPPSSTLGFSPPPPSTPKVSPSISSNLEVNISPRGRSASTAGAVTESLFGEDRKVFVDERPSSADSEAKRRSGLGLLHFCIQFFPIRKRLRVSVMKAESIGGQLRPDLELHAILKISLMPGKVQKQTSSVAKRNRDAVFNEEFFFDNITAEEVKKKSVNIRVCHHRGGKQFHKDVLIGEVDVPLSTVPELASKKEIHLQRPLKSKLNAKKLGKVHVTTCLEVERKCLTVNVIKVENLPKLDLSGNPDPCVRVTVVQPGKIQTKQTRTLKNTRSAVYKEAVMFVIDTKPEPLENTDVMIAVVDTVRSSGGVDDILGEAYLGISAVDKTEQDQWKNSVANPGKEYKAAHILKPSRNSKLS